ncbi:hypothetical protein BBBOND_0310890 [Babesia bigemina]|uniref:Uncharacterized protein n=1 Tax=Babesia bigemina TaxID=5866 RepID=A0A061D909_BABBI|nr:hypothetical protein BBBOND_0310890 [Babesia bigemina]CDR97186.1 hypothetical protein BBBOND_0310890 [Babesia bigemina]|eukprot:XP_012769372.1 hypothetical protein BBBOND_0310890 [Babesia bigemina]
MVPSKNDEAAITASQYHWLYNRLYVTTCGTNVSAIGSHHIDIRGYLATVGLCGIGDAIILLEFRLGITESITYLAEYFAKAYVINFTHDVKDQDSEGRKSDDASKSVAYALPRLFPTHFC